jgi:hypothetical protein
MHFLVTFHLMAGILSLQPSTTGSRETRLPLPPRLRNTTGRGVASGGTPDVDCSIFRKVELGDKSDQGAEAIGTTVGLRNRCVLFLIRITGERSRLRRPLQTKSEPLRGSKAPQKSQTSNDTFKFDLFPTFQMRKLTNLPCTHSLTQQCESRMA